MIDASQFDDEGGDGFSFACSGVAMHGKFALVTGDSQGLLQLRRRHGVWKIDRRVQSPGVDDAGDPHQPGWINFRESVTPATTFDNVAIAPKPMRNGRYLGLAVDHTHRTIAVVSGVGSATPRLVGALRARALGNDALDQGTGGVVFLPGSSDRVLMATMTGFAVLRLRDPAEPRLKVRTKVGDGSQPPSSITVTSDADHVAVAAGGHVFGYRNVLAAVQHGKRFHKQTSFRLGSSGTESVSDVAYTANGTLVVLHGDPASIPTGSSPWSRRFRGGTTQSAARPRRPLRPTPGASRSGPRLRRPDRPSGTLTPADPPSESLACRTRLSVAPLSGRHCRPGEGSGLGRRTPHVTTHACTHRGRGAHGDDRLDRHDRRRLHCSISTDIRTPPHTAHGAPPEHHREGEPDPSACSARLTATSRSSAAITGAKAKKSALLDVTTGDAIASVVNPVGGNDALFCDTDGKVFVAKHLRTSPHLLMTPINTHRFTDEGDSGYGSFCYGVAMHGKFALATADSQGLIQLIRKHGDWKIDTRVHSPGHNDADNPHRRGWIDVKDSTTKATLLNQVQIAPKPLPNGKFLAVALDRDEDKVKRDTAVVFSGVGTAKPKVLGAVHSRALAIEDDNFGDMVFGSGGMAFVPGSAKKALILTRTGFAVLGLNNPAHPRLKNRKSISGTGSAQPNSITISKDGDHVAVAVGSTVYAYKNVRAAIAKGKRFKLQTSFHVSSDIDDVITDVGYTSNNNLLVLHGPSSSEHRLGPDGRAEGPGGAPRDQGLDQHDGSRGPRQPVAVPDAVGGRPIRGRSPGSRGGASRCAEPGSGLGDLVGRGLPARDQTDAGVGHPVTEDAGVRERVGRGGRELHERHVDVDPLQQAAPRRRPATSARPPARPSAGWHARRGGATARR